MLDGLDLHRIRGFSGESQKGPVDDGEQLGLNYVVAQNLVNGIHIAD